MRTHGNIVLANLQQTSSTLDDIGVANAYAVSFVPPALGYTYGLEVIFKAANDNTGASTLAVDTYGPVPIVKQVNQDLAPGDILAGEIINVIYDGTYFQMIATPTILTPQISTYLIDGGQISWVVNYDYIVAAADYVILGVQYASPQTPITLAPADPTFDRYDLVVVDTNNTVQVITGNATVNPQEPSYDPATQIPLAFIKVEAGTTQPSCVALVAIYRENAGTPTEWAVASSNLLMMDPASTSNPRTGSVDIEGIAVASGNTLTFTPLSPVSSTNITQLDIFIRSKGSWGTTANGHRFSITFNVAAGQIGLPVIVPPRGAFGFNSSTTGLYQLVAIPRTAFNIPDGAMITSIVFQVAGTSGSMGFYLDDISIEQNCVITPPPAGQSGFSGYSGQDGIIGSNGASGYSGYSGSGVSGYSGFSGAGISGYSGFSGIGDSGYSGYSGNAASGYSGYSGFSGIEGSVGPQGIPGLTGTSGYSGYSGGSGYSGYSGLSGYSGYSGANPGASGYSGFSGTNPGLSGYSGYSGANPGASGYSGFSGFSGATGPTGTGPRFAVFGEDDTAAQNRLFTGTGFPFNLVFDDAIPSNAFTISGAGTVSPGGSFPALATIDLAATSVSGGAAGSTAFKVINETTVGSFMINKGIHARAFNGTVNYGIFSDPQNSNEYGLVVQGSNSATGIISGTAGVGSTAIYAYNDIGIGIDIPISGGGIPLNISQNNLSDDLQIYAKFTRFGNNPTTSNALGGSFDFYELDDGGLMRLLGKQIMSLSDISTGSYSGQYKFQLSNSTVLTDILTLDGATNIQFNRYGVGTFAGSETYLLGVDGSGNVIEVTGGGGSITADNGLTMSTATNVELGGTLSQDTTIDGGAFYELISTSSNSNVTFNSINSGTGQAIFGWAQGANSGIVGQGGTAGVQGISDGIFGAVLGQTVSGVAFYANLLGSTNDTVQSAIRIARQTPGTASNGVGSSIDFAANTDVQLELANQLISIWTDATDTTRTSQFQLTGVDLTIDSNPVVIGNFAVQQVNISATNTTDNAGINLYPNILDIRAESGGAVNQMYQVFDAGTNIINIVNFQAGASTSAVIPAITIESDISGTIVNGFGLSIDLWSARSQSVGPTTSLVSKWSNISTSTSEFDIVGIAGGFTKTLLQIMSEGQFWFTGGSSAVNIFINDQGNGTSAGKFVVDADNSGNYETGLYVNSDNGTLLNNVVSISAYSDPHTTQVNVNPSYAEVHHNDSGTHKYLRFRGNFTPANSTDATYPEYTLTTDDTNLYYRKSDGTWVKMVWQTF